MNIEWLEDFLALAEERHFSRAAERRNITQPAFGRRIRALEDWVGTALFTRSKGGTALNAPGEHFQMFVQAPLRGLYRARAEAREVAGRAQTVLTIAATHALSFTFFPHWIRQHAPHEPLNLKSDSMQACEQLMLRGDASFLLSHSHPMFQTALSDKEFISIKVGEDRLVPVCQPDEEGQPRWSAHDVNFPFLAYSPESGLGRILDAHWNGARRKFEGVTVVQSRLAATLLTMASEGQGVAWVPRSLAGSMLSSGAVVLAESIDEFIPVEIALTRPRSRLSTTNESLWQIFRDAPISRS